MTTGYVYDPVFLQHTEPHHPEDARRLVAVLNAITRANLWPSLQAIPSRAATNAELLAVHTPAYLERVQRLSAQGGGELGPDTYATAATWQAAAVAAGSLIELALAVVDGRVNNGFALLRPPGHHALAGQAMGFCVFANVALAAKAAQKARSLERIAVIDFDVHHGNGTQALLGDDPAFWFCSSHQHPFYPGTGAAADCQPGRTVNLPLPAGSGDANVEAVYRRIAAPLLRRFQPQLILVSAGYDGHRKDGMAYLNQSLTGLARLSEMLIALSRELCGGKIVFALEGGYQPEALANGVVNTLKALLGRADFADPFEPSIWLEPDISDLLATLERIHRLA